MAQEKTITRDGFQVLKRNFLPPADTTQLGSDMKRRITICNLFVNHKLTIKDITRILDETYTQAVGTLIEQGIIAERRHVPRGQPKSDRPSRSLLSTRLKNIGSTQ